MTESLAAGHPVTLAHAASMADGLLAVRPGDLTFEHVRALIDQVVRVSEDEIADAVRFLARHTKIVVEPSGATSVAGARRLAPPGATGVHVAVVSGGNVEPTVFADLLRG
jgi:threonine dehydratase